MGCTTSYSIRNSASYFIRNSASNIQVPSNLMQNRNLEEQLELAGGGGVLA
jgi:hypothetical protein